jgi:hypothetical protein
MNTVAQLTQLRQDLEQQTGLWVADLQINTACVFYDVAEALGMSEQQVRRVVGPTAFDMIVIGVPPACPFGDRECRRVECLGADCNKFGDRWAFVDASRDQQEAADG